MLIELILPKIMRKIFLIILGSISSITILRDMQVVEKQLSV